MVEKAATLTPDEVFFDLEDACAPAEKDPARAELVARLPTLELAANRVAVRVNAVTTPWCYRDVIEIAKAGVRVDALIVPKVEDASHVHFIEHLLTQVEYETGRPRRMELELLIETARGVVNLKEILSASDRVAALIFGPGDYAASIGITQLGIGGFDPDYPGHETHWVLSEIAAHAHAFGVLAIDGPVGDFRDETAFRTSARLARRLGFDGKWCVHPAQIPWSNDVFSPSPEEVAAARELLAAYDAAVAEGRGAIALDGRLVDGASRRLAESILGRSVDEPRDSRL